LLLVAQGMTNREIGEALVVTTETVKWHLKNIYRKLDASNRTEAVTRARRLGIID
jgi:LuxR family maltose regulon positive regulatory protein